ncbi:MAG: hypothetical protein WBL93_14205 [Lutisporaceae bacterium]
MSFDVNGYLGSQVEQIKKDNYEKHKTLFEKCEELNRFAHSVKFKFDKPTSARHRTYEHIYKTHIFH